MTNFDEEMLLLRQHYSPTGEDQARVRGALNVTLGVAGLGAADALGKAAAGAGSSQAPPAAILGAVGTGSTGAALQAGLVTKVVLACGVSVLAAATGLTIHFSEKERAADQRDATPQGVSTSAPVGFEGHSAAERPESADLDSKDRFARELPDGLSPRGGDGAVRDSAPDSASESAEEAIERLEGSDRASVKEASSPTGRRAPAVQPRQEDGTVGKETELLAGASLALREGHPEEAEQALSRHAKEFEDGKLAPEREGLVLLANCRNRRSPGLRKKVTAFIRAYPTSPLVKHLRSACLESAAHHEQAGKAVDAPKESNP